jgi:hypothetical protein
VTTTAYFVDTASAGGDGTTDALSGANAAYSSLNSGLNARAGTIAAGDIMVFYCAGGSDTNSCAITSGAGWSIADQDGLQIRPNDTNTDPHGLATQTNGHHRGIPGSAYRIQSSANTTLMNIARGGVLIDGIELSTTSLTSATSCVYDQSTGNGGSLSNLIICAGSTGGTTRKGLRPRQGRYRNIFVFGGDVGVVSSLNNGSNATIDNVTVVGCSSGFAHVGTGTHTDVFRNCVALNNTNDWHLVSTGSWGTGGATNATGEASGGPSSITQTSVSSLEIMDASGSVASGPGDLANPLSITTKLDGNGTDRTSVFTDDITSQRTRTSTFDIGAYALRSDVFRLVLDADGTLDTTNLDHDAGTGTPYYTHMSDSPDGASTDWVANTLYNTGTYYNWASLENVPTDFGSMDAVTVTVDGVLSGTVSNDTVAFSCRIYDADNSTTTPLAGDSGTILDETNTTRLTARATMATPSGTKTAWDGAYIRFAWAYAKSAGPDNIDLRIHGLVIDCEYTASSGSTFNETIGLTAAAAAASSRTASLAASVSLSAAGAVSPSRTLTATDTVALAAQGTIGAAGGLIIDETVALTSSALVVGARTLTMSEVASLAASAVAASSATLTMSEVASLAASALAASSATLDFDEALALTSTAAMASSRTITADESAALTAAAVVATSRGLTLSETTALAATAAMADSRTLTLNEVTSLAASALVADSRTLTLAEQLAMAVVASLGITPTGDGTETVSMASVAGLNVSATLIAERSVALVAAAVIPTYPTQDFSESIALAAQGAVAASRTLTVEGTITLVADSSVAASTQLVANPQVALAAQVDFTLGLSGSIYQGSVTLSADAVLAAVGGLDTLIDTIGLGASTGFSASATLKWEQVQGVTVEWVERPAATGTWILRPDTDTDWTER